MTRPRTAADLLRDRTRAPAGDGAEADALATLSDVFATDPVSGAATGFVAARLAGRRGPVLWIQDRLSRREAGRLYLSGLDCALEVIGVEVSRPRDVLWAMEEGLGCGELAGVVGEIWGEAPALDFTATKRLALRSEARALPCWLVRRAATPALSAARERWRLSALPALPDPHDMRAPGPVQWQAELFRSRLRAPGTWVARPRPGGGVELSHRVDQATPPQASLSA